MIIRVFEERDATAVAQLMFDSFHPIFGDRIGTVPHTSEYWINSSLSASEEAETISFVAEEDGRIVGYIGVTANRWCDLGVLNSIGVDSHVSCKGIGSALYCRAEEFFRERGMRKIHTCVASINPRAQIFYRKNGFYPEGILKDHFFIGVDEIQLAKIIK